MQKENKKRESIAEKIMKIINRQSMTAEDIKKELKDRFGYNEKLKDIRVNLLYLLRRGRVKREKDKKIYKYHI